MAAQQGRRTGGARQRLVAVALDLFARHGISGTSLQMIADRLGVTKAAVYHQFPSKDEIVQAVIAPALQGLGAVADAAEARESRAGRRDAALAGLADLIVRNRRLAAMLYSDPVIAGLIRDHPVLRGLSDRITVLLTGPDPDAETLVAASMVGGGLAAAGVDPRLAGLPDDTMRALLLATARRTLRIGPARRSAAPIRPAGRDTAA